MTYVEYDKSPDLWTFGAEVYGIYVSEVYGPEHRDELELEQWDDVYYDRKPLKRIAVHYDVHFQEPPEKTYKGKVIWKNSRWQKDYNLLGQIRPKKGPAWAMNEYMVFVRMDYKTLNRKKAKIRTKKWGKAAVRRLGYDVQ